MEQRKKERGAALALVVICMTVILGAMALAVDIGMGVVTKSRLQRAADAAALAGAMSLPGDFGGAYNEALDFCGRHGVDPGDVSVGLSLSYPNRIQVQISSVVNYSFAKILGFTHGTVAVAAQAENGVIGGMGGVIPIGVEKREFVFGESYMLKRGAGSCGAGEEWGGCSNFGPLALGGFGANVYESNLTYGYDGIIRAGDWIPTETGNMVGPTGAGLMARLEGGIGETFADFPTGSRRLVFLPIIESLDVDGRTDVLVLGFAAFFLEDYVNPGEIHGKFVRRLAPGEIYTPGEDFGLSGVKLVD